MTNKTALLLNDPGPHSHFVYPSADERMIGEAVLTFASAGLRKGDAVILVTVQTRREVIQLRLAKEGFDLENLQAKGQLAFIDAAALLNAFLADGMPDAVIFKTKVGEIIEQASINPDTGEPRKVRIFGEMVSLLYMASNVPAAERLEEFWNELVESHAISLFCAYSLRPGADCCLPSSLVNAHSHTISSLDLVN